MTARRPATQWARVETYINLMVVVTFILVVLVVIVTAWQRYRDFVEYHEAIARRAAATVAEDVSQFLDRRYRQVRIFAEDNSAQLAAVADQPENFALQEQLQSRVARHFPESFSYTLATLEGDPLLEDFEGYVSELCIREIRSYIDSARRATRIHPNTFGYHFDVMSPWQASERGGILMISFQPDVLGRLLETSQAPGHRLMLVIRDESALIEVTAQGPRNVLSRQNYHLTADEDLRTLATRMVPESRWQVVDLREAGFYEAYRNEVALQSIMQIVIFLIVGGGIWYLIHRIEHRQREIEKMKDEFISVVSHELRTPLTSLQGALSLMNSSAVPEPYKREELVSLAQRNTARLVELVNDLLDVRSLETGRLELKPRTLGISQLVQENLEENLGYGERFSVRLSLDNQLKEERFVHADPVRIGQVISNLISNAIKFSPVGETVHVRVLEPVPGRVQVRVEDKGPGIDPAFRSRIFQRFAQADSTDSRRARGTGLGLHIVKSLVQLHGGTVDFDSSLGVGSSFYFELPVAEPPASV